MRREKFLYTQSCSIVNPRLQSTFQYPGFLLALIFWKLKKVSWSVFAFLEANEMQAFCSATERELKMVYFNVIDAVVLWSQSSISTCVRRVQSLRLLRYHRNQRRPLLLLPIFPLHAISLHPHTLSCFAHPQVYLTISLFKKMIQTMHILSQFC